MREVDWAKEIAVQLDNFLKLGEQNLKVEAGVKLPYAFEIKEYNSNGEPHITDKMKYETDILISEHSKNETWKPRVIIECKIKSVTTHDSITYSKKANSHKNIHPYLRYGIMLGKRDHHPLPGRLFRHGENFDFMISLQEYSASKIEWNDFTKLIKSEIEASRNLEQIIYNSRNKNRVKVTVLHKPLLLNKK